jgi:hypothetical protein
MNYQTIKEFYQKSRIEIAKKGWTAAGIAVPILFSRYVLYNDIKGGILPEIVGWTAATITIAPALPITGALGYAFGQISASHLKHKYNKKKGSSIEEKLDVS